MNRNVIIGAIVVIVILALGLWYWEGTTPGMTTGDNTASTTDQTASSTAGTGTTNASLRTLATQGGNYTCTISNSGTTGSMTGTIYGAGGKTRLDFSIRTNDGAQVMTHIIRSNGYSYTWVDGQQTGTKAAITSSTPIIQQPQGGVIEVNDTSSFASECHPWLTDATQFVPPAGITF